MRKKKKLKKEPKQTTLHNEIPIVENGERVEVQVLEEGEIFDPNKYLEHFRNPSPPPGVHYCPLHYPTPMKKNTARNGWEYYTCPEKDCFIFTDAENVDEYSKSVEAQLHEYYRVSSRVKLHCYCNNALSLCRSRSYKNPGRMYFRCRKGQCDFFQWAEEEPKRKVKAWLEGEEYRGGDWKPRGFEVTPRHPSRDKDGYPKRGFDEVPTWPQRPPSPEPIPFDRELWNQCQVEKFWLTDSNNVIGFPREIQGHVYSPENEKELREKLYTLRILEKDQSWKRPVTG